MCVSCFHTHASHERTRRRTCTRTGLVPVAPQRARVLVPERWRVTTPAAPGSVISVRCSPSDACRCGLRHRRRWCPWAWRHVMRHVWSRCLHHRGLRPGPSLVEVPTGSRVVSYRTRTKCCSARKVTALARTSKTKCSQCLLSRHISLNQTCSYVVPISSDYFMLSLSALT